MYKNFDDIPVTFSPLELADILGISKTKAYELSNRIDFPKIKIGRRIVICKKHFIEWLDKEIEEDMILPKYKKTR